MSGPKVARGLQRSRPHRTIAMVLLLLGASVLLMTSGGSIKDSALSTIAVTIQMVTGAAIWASIRPKRTMSAVELAGVGVVFGSIGTVLGAQAFRLTPFHRWGWLAPTVATALLLLTSSSLRTNVRRSLQSIERLAARERTALGAATIGGLIPVIVFWRRHPLDWDGYLTYYVDIPFHEALAHSVHTYGPGESIFAFGRAIRYHWFSHGWIGALADWADTAPFFVVTRVVPIVALIASAFVAWAWARQLSTTWWVPPLATLLVTSGSYVGLLGFGNQLIPLSPSQSFSTAWLLAFSLLVTDFMADRLGRRVGVSLLGILGFALVGGKASHALAIAGGMAFLAVRSLTMDKTHRNTALTASIAAGAGVVAGYFILISGASGNELTVGFERTASSVMGLEPPVLQPMSILLGMMSLMLAMFPRWMGAAAGWRTLTRVNPVEAWYGLGVVTAGLGALMLTTHVGTSQLYFALSASAVLCVLSARGLELAWHDMPETPSDPPGAGRLVRLTLLIGVTSAGLAEAIRLVLGSGSAWWRWGAPLAAWMGVVLVGRFVLRTMADSGLKGLGPLVAGAMVAGSVASLVLTNAPLLATADPEMSTAQYGMSREHIAAGLWLRANSEVSDLVVTNRLCSDATDQAPSCSSRWFLTGAVAGRRIWLEGFDYGVNMGWLPDWTLRRIEVISSYTSRPTTEEHATIWSAGIRWVWLDRAVPHANEWNGFGAVVFSNSATTILKLRPPK